LSKCGIGRCESAQRGQRVSGSFYHWVPSKKTLGVEVIDAFAEADAELRAELLLADGRVPLQRLRDYFNHVNRATRVVARWNQHSQKEEEKCQLFGSTSSKEN
jgi:AcrR family transcriptional regulator